MEERIYRQLMELVRIPSVTGSEGETEIARFIYKSLAEESYFKKHPSHLNLVPGPDEKRCSVVALVRSSADVSDTVLFIGHFDVVGVEVYGDLANKAFDPEALRQALQALPMDEQAKADLGSDNWIIGRGVRGMFRQIGGAVSVTLATLVVEIVGDPVRGYALAFIGIGVAFIATIPLIFMMPSHPQASKQEHTVVMG